MIMNEFLSRVQKQMIILRKKNLNLMNQFKIEMYQARKNIEKQSIKVQFRVEDSQFIDNQPQSNYVTVSQKQQSVNKCSYKNLSTNNQSRLLQCPLNDGCHVSRFSSHVNKENQDPNRRVNSQISVIEQFPVKNSNNHTFDFENQFNLNALKNDYSIEINTQEVKKKYRKFISPSAGWAGSADSLRQRQQIPGIDPFCNLFVHEPENFNENQIQHIKNETDIFGFRQIDERHFSRANTIKQCEQIEQNNESSSNR